VAMGPLREVRSLCKLGCRRHACAHARTGCVCVCVWGGGGCARASACAGRGAAARCSCKGPARDERTRNAKKASEGRPVATLYKAVATPGCGETKSTHTCIVWQYAWGAPVGGAAAAASGRHMVAEGCWCCACWSHVGVAGLPAVHVRVRSASSEGAHCAVVVCVGGVGARTNARTTLQCWVPRSRLYPASGASTAFNCTLAPRFAGDTWPRTAT
jgi:hypothetical protein